MVWADELEDNYDSLKAAEGKKDAEGVRKFAAATSKLARAAAAAPQPSAADQVQAWKERVDYAKQVDTYTEYALGTLAGQPGVQPAQTVELVDQLLAQNSKSKYLDVRCLAAYVSALDSLAASMSSKSPEQALRYANKMASVGSRAKPEGAAEADWDKVKGAGFGIGNYYAGAIHGQRQSWQDCDRDLREALPYISKDNTKLGVAYFYLGLCNYQFGRLTADRARMQQAQKYSEQSAALPGPMQAQARQNAYAIRTELGTPAKR
jgi:hypothetical protein